MGQAKRNQQRHCPALGENITPTICATNRNSEISCPGDCPHNPFNPAHYLTTYQTLEAAAVKNLSIMLYEDPDFNQIGGIKKAIREEDGFSANALHVWHIHGEDRFAKWLDQGAFRNWKNDDLVMAHSLDNIRGAVIEVQGVLDDRTILVRDLLRPDEPPFVLIDVSTAAKACRFDIFLTWVYPIPGGLHRLSGLAFVVPDLGTMNYSEAFSILLKHLGAPDVEREKWLLEKMSLIRQALTATATARNTRQYEISDLVVYERTCRTGGKPPLADARAVRDFAARLLQHPLICQDGPGSQVGPILRASLLTSPTSDEAMVESVGTISIYPAGEIRLWSLGKKHSASLLDFMRAFEPSLAVTAETLKDLGKEKIKDMGHWDPALVPPALLENVSAITLQSSLFSKKDDCDPLVTSMTSSFEKFADIPIPALDGCTPRDAAVDPILRPRLLDLMKQHVHMVDQSRRSKGIDFDINPLLEELGLLEIIHAPSPCGVRNAKAGNHVTGHHHVRTPRRKQKSGPQSP